MKKEERRKNFYCGDEVDYGDQCIFQCENCVDATGVDYGYLPYEEDLMMEVPMAQYPKILKHEFKVVTTEDIVGKRLEKYSERFDNDKSPIGNPETWGKRLVDETIEEVAHKMLIDFGIKSMGQSIGVLEVKKLMVKIAKCQQENSCKHNYILTTEQGHRVIKCLKCDNSQPI